MDHGLKVCKPLGWDMGSAQCPAPLMEEHVTSMSLTLISRVDASCPVSLEWAPCIAHPALETGGSPGRGGGRGWCRLSICRPGWSSPNWPVSTMLWTWDKASPTSRPQTSPWKPFSTPSAGTSCSTNTRGHLWVSPSLPGPWTQASDEPGKEGEESRILSPAIVQCSLSVSSVSGSGWDSSWSGKRQTKTKKKKQNTRKQRQLICGDGGKWGRKKGGSEKAAWRRWHVSRALKDKLLIDLTLNSNAFCKGPQSSYLPTLGVEQWLFNVGVHRNCQEGCSLQVHHPGTTTANNLPLWLECSDF